MDIHDLQQGSPEWLAFRRTHRPASMAAVMLGRSPYMTRTEYLNAMVTGLWPEPSHQEQVNFDEGHRTERLMRPIVERHLGFDLYPVVGSDGDLSASLDGFFEAEDGNWENKLLNQELEAALPVAGLENADQNDARALPQHFRDQLEQQCLVAKVERVFFTAARFAADGTLLDVRACWYESDMELAIEIVGGWKQFDADLKKHVPVARVEKVRAEPVEDFPVLAPIVMKGDVQITHELGGYKAKLKAYLAQLPKDPKTDQEFANLEDSVKRRDALEKALKAERERALRGSANIAALLTAIDELLALSRDTRLADNSKVTTQKEKIRQDIRAAAQADFDAHVRSWNDRLPRPLLSTVRGTIPDALIPEGMSGKKSVNGWREGASNAVAEAKVKVNTIAERLVANFAHFAQVGAGHEHLFRDVDTLVFKDCEAFTVICADRIREDRVREEQRLAAERARLEREAADRAQRELEAKQRAEAAALAEQQRQQQAAAEAGQHQAAPAPAAGPAVIPMPQRAAAAAEPELQPAAAPPASRGEPTMTLTMLCQRLGFTVTAAFMESLGFTATTRQNSKLYHLGDFEAICLAIRQHLRTLVETHRQQQKEAA